MLTMKVDRVNSIERNNQILTGAAGVSKAIPTSIEYAWSVIVVEGDLDGGTLVFEVGRQETGQFFNYPGFSGTPADHEYPATGITGPGIYIFPKDIGNLYGRFTYSGAGESANFTATAQTQMV